MHPSWSHGEPYQQHTAFMGSSLHRQSQAASKLVESERIKPALHKAIWMLLQWTLKSRSIWPWGKHQTQPGSLHMCCSVLELPDLPKTKKLRENHGMEVLLPAQDPSWLWQKSESINSTKLTPYAQCCSTAFPKVYKLTCITRIFPFSAVTQLFVILSDIKQNYINIVLKWLSLLRNYLKYIDNNPSWFSSIVSSQFSSYFNSSMFPFPRFLHLSQDSSKFSS